MRQLLVATRSLGKQAEFRSLLARLPFELVFPQDVGLQPQPEEDGLEIHETFEANARAKAHWFHDASGLTTLADDSGLEVDALGGAPGVHSKRFAGQSGSDEGVTAANNAKLLAALVGVNPAERTARYRSVLALVGAECAELVASGVTEGHILQEARGGNGFGYDPLFFSDELGVTFGEAEAAGKHAVSHRGRAVEALVTLLTPAGEA